MSITNLGKLGHLSWNERWLLFQSFLLLPVFHLALLILGYSRLRSLLEKIIPLKTIDESPSEVEILGRARGIAGVIEIAARHGLYRATCLRRSLLVWWFLRKQGIQSQICFGVRLLDRQLEAHAWVELQGIVVNDSLDVVERYLALEDTLPPTRQGL